jgi:hypothetical protein
MEIYGYPDPTLDLKKAHKLIASIERRVGTDGYAHTGYTFTPDGKPLSLRRHGAAGARDARPVRLVRREATTRACLAFYSSDTQRGATQSVVLS